VVVDEIDIENSAILKAKDDPPIGSHRHRPEPFELALELVKSKARTAQVFDDSCGVKRGKDDADALGHVGRKQPPIIVFEKPPKTFVSKALDHRRLVTCHMTCVNRSQRAELCCLRLARRHQLDEASSPGEAQRNLGQPINLKTDDLLAHCLLGHAPRGVSADYVSRMALAMWPAMGGAQRKISKRIVELLGGSDRLFR